MDRVQGIASRGGVAITTGVPSTNKLIQSYPLCTVTVYNTGTLTITPIFSDSDGVTPKANPFTSELDASFAFYVPNGHYDIHFSGTGIDDPFTLSDIPVGSVGTVGDNIPTDGTDAWAIF